MSIHLQSHNLVNLNSKLLRMLISIIEDSQTIGHIISSTLKTYGYIPRVVTSKTIDTKGLPNAKLHIINSMLKEHSSEKIMKALKSQDDPPGIIFINNKGTWKDNVRLLDLGADDVLSYPFPMQELLSRIKAIQNRSVTSHIKIYESKNLVVDQTKQLAYLADSPEEPFNLRRKEFSLLKYLMRNKERPISRSELLDNVWDYRRINNSNTVDVHVNSLRKKLGKRAFIKTVHGFGYQLNDSEPTPKVNDKELVEPNEIV